MPAKHKKLTDLIKNNLDDVRMTREPDHPSGTDKHSDHSYLTLYDELFSSRRDTAKNILEIGIWDGGSIKLWHDYFANANIYGIDVEECRTGPWLNDYERITTYRRDAFNFDFVVTEFIKKGIEFDVVIDDGPHTIRSQFATAHIYNHVLSDDGILIIEDIQDFDQIKTIITAFPERLLKNIQVIDRRKLKNREDDIVIVCDKSGQLTGPDGRVWGQNASYFLY